MVRFKYQTCFKLHIGAFVYGRPLLSMYITYMRMTRLMISYGTSPSCDLRMLLAKQIPSFSSYKKIAWKDLSCKVTDYLSFCAWNGRDTVQNKLENLGQVWIYPHVLFIGCNVSCIIRKHHWPYSVIQVSCFDETCCRCLNLKAPRPQCTISIEIIYEGH